MTEKTIKEFVSEVQSVFGKVEYEAVSYKQNHQGRSSGWVASAPMVEVNSDDYLKMAKGIDIKNPPSPQAVGVVLKAAIKGVNK